MINKKSLHICKDGKIAIFLKTFFTQFSLSTLLITFFYKNAMQPIVAFFQSRIGRLVYINECSI